MQILNTNETEILYLNDGVSSLTDFVPNYNFSSDVVLNGRASCYFDLYGGNAEAIGREMKEANITVFAIIIAMKRNGQAVENISDFAGLSRTNPLLAFFFAMLAPLTMSS